ncbi:Tm-1-like ATP-binding domain-containing protein [Novacetimonas pomaceti]|uniref:UPF0261 protein C3920_11105 n=1 Tax=Novacetimonas pomaceti TaxID=2021998 RepID=A0ABX5P0H0_9PROT|nr:Tm-1-like ATP-binding domain-containing protein [Novacetimonas pomaceti]MBV1833896.1 Tm-1-like ATP-binding domain-containing protein [Novacetimonas pomaceti]PYD47258.1 hypothetical protein C3920_11105 [Novacetimonas pomaceti]
MGRVYVVGTCDTKAVELRYVRDLLTGQGISAVIVDVSTALRAPCSGQPDMIDPATVAAAHPDGPQAVFTRRRGSSIAAMATALRRFLCARDDVDGVLGIGGSGGTALIAPALQALPLGLPKMMVSTVASGNVAPYVGGSDIAMVYSVTDMEGLNRLSRRILANAANAMAGMAAHLPPATHDTRPAVGLTMFGLTTPCVERIVSDLEDTFDCMVFHATGTGGRAMERMADSGQLAGIIDVTTTEICDFLSGGIFPCDDDRLGAAIRTGVPYVGSCGALDMVNFGAIDTVPARYRDRVLVEHNPQVTLMRTSVEECRAMGEWIGHRLNRCEGEVRFFLPEGGFSLLDRMGEPFYDPQADQTLFEALERTVEQTPRRRLIPLPYGVNDTAFADTLAATFRSLFNGEHS